MTDAPTSLETYDFDLPEALIALRPAPERSSARLLVRHGDETTLAAVSDLPDFLRPGDMLVFNDTKVIPARLKGQRTRAGATAQVEITLVAGDGLTWRAMARPARKLAPGDEIVFGRALTARVLEREEGGFVRLDLAPEGDLDAALDAVGVVPLPPYISARRDTDAEDKARYQTIFAARNGAIAAPTASLHFDEPLLAALAAREVMHTFVTLHVGIGTFLPVTANDIRMHKMHAEWGEITGEAATAINEARRAGGRIIPVGTTALRLLESAAAPDGTLSPFRGETDIFIKPGYEFRITDGLMTNFHLPKSTLMMLVSALMGIDAIRDIYATAIRERFRFFSYGDSSLLLPERRAR